MLRSGPLAGDNGSTPPLSDVYYIQVHLSFRGSWPRVTPRAWGHVPGNKTGLRSEPNRYRTGTGTGPGTGAGTGTGTGTGPAVPVPVKVAAHRPILLDLALRPGPSLPPQIPRFATGPLVAVSTAPLQPPS